MDQKGSRPTNSDQYPFFGENLALGIALELLLGPSTELIITVHKIRNDNTSQWWFSWFSISSLIEFLTFPVCFKCWTTHRMVNVKFLINFSCNCKRISFSDPLNWSWSTSKGQPWCSSSARLYLCRTSWATTALYVHWELLGQMCCWCCKMSPLLYDPFWTWIRKLLKFAFCLTSFP